MRCQEQENVNQSWRIFGSPSHHPEAESEEAVRTGRRASSGYVKSQHHPIVTGHLDSRIHKLFYGQSYRKDAGTVREAIAQYDLLTRTYPTELCSFGVFDVQSLVDTLWTSLRDVRPQLALYAHLERTQGRHAGLVWWTQDEIASKFLERHPCIGSTLRKAKGFIESSFKEEFSVSIVVVADPEDGRQSVIATICCSGTSEYGSASLRNFYNDWWYEHVEDAQYLLSFSVVTHAL